MAPLLCLQDWGLVKRSWERSRQSHSIQVETAGEFRCRLRWELACRLHQDAIERYEAIREPTESTLDRLDHSAQMEAVGNYRFRLMR